MKKAKDIIKKFNPCQSAIDWLEDRTVEEMVKDCHRGDWLIWLASKTKIDLKTLTLAKVKCVRTVQHLMTDKRSLDALDIAEKFANGDASKDELTVANAVAYTAYAAAATATNAANAAYFATAAATADNVANAYADNAATAAAYAAAYANAYANAATDADYATTAVFTAPKKENEKQTADICREIFGDWLIETLIRK